MLKLIVFLLFLLYMPSENHIKIYNTFNKRLDTIYPDSDNTIKIYLCGVTVYDKSHIGHARTIITFDVLRRYLLYKKYKVIFIENFTDVDDKIINKAKEQQISPSKLANTNIKQYFKDFTSLNVLKATKYPRATKHINEIQDLISNILKKKYGYITSTGIYFNVKKFPNYGKLSGKTIENLKSGIRISVDDEKQNPVDFALWKFSNEKPNWTSPWGNGRPGWHIECSAMAMKYLGNNFHIHGGGNDLIFPHHENEIAQSESVTNQNPASIWLHTGLVNIESNKMSKSLGNVVSVEQILELFGPNVIRLYVISSHYRSPLNYNEKTVMNAVTNWKLIENAISELQSTINLNSNIKNLTKTLETEFSNIEKALDNDFNIPLSLGAFMRIIKLINRTASEGKLSITFKKTFEKKLTKIMDIYGFKLPYVTKLEAKEIEMLIDKRTKFRLNKQFNEADKIRQILNDKKIEITDYQDRIVWRKTT